MTISRVNQLHGFSRLAERLNWGHGSVHYSTQDNKKPPGPQQLSFQMTEVQRAGKATPNPTFRNTMQWDMLVQTRSQSTNVSDTPQVTMYAK